MVDSRNLNLGWHVPTVAFLACRTVVSRITDTQRCDLKHGFAWAADVMSHVVGYSAREARRQPGYAIGLDVLDKSAILQGNAEEAARVTNPFP